MDEAVAGLRPVARRATPYLFGEAFLRYLSERFGRETVPELARVHAGRIIPYLDDLTAKKVTGPASTPAGANGARRPAREMAGREAARIEAARPDPVARR